MLQRTFNFQLLALFLIVSASALPAQADIEGRLKIADSEEFAEAGQIRYVDSTAQFEGFDGTEWRSFWETNSDYLYQYEDCSYSDFQIDTDAFGNVACGRLYDSGGPAGNYGNDEDYSFTIITGASSERTILCEIIVDMVDMEGSGDTLTLMMPYQDPVIYTGSISAPDTFYSVTPDGVVVTFTSNSSNPGGPYDGFQIEWRHIYGQEDSSQVKLSGFFFKADNQAVGGGVNIDSAWQESGRRSVQFGYASDARGDFTVALGPESFALGQQSISIGREASANGPGAIAQGYLSKAVGMQTISIGLGAESELSNSIAMGVFAKTQGISSVAIGQGAVTVDPFSISLGAFSGTSGAEALSIGRGANSNGIYAISIGSSASSDSIYALSLGYAAAASQRSTIAIGHQSEALDIESIALGNEARANGQGSIALGPSAISDHDYSVVIGSDARIQASSAIVIGREAGRSFGSEGDESVMIGSESEVSGDTSVAIGLLSKAARKGVSIGAKADALTEGVAIGYDSDASHNSVSIGRSSRTYRYSVSIGDDAHTGVSADSSVVLGYKATSSGHSGLAIGQNTYAREDNCMAIGPNAETIAFARNAMALGHEAQVGQSGHGSIAIGHKAEVANFDENSIALGQEAYASTDNQIVLGNTAVSQIGGYSNWSNLSDGRFKKDIRENIPGLRFINSLRPVGYKVDYNKLAAFQGRELSSDLRIKNLARAETFQSGFIAQEVEASAKKIGYDFDGVIAPQDDNSHYALSYSSFVVPLVKAVQELSLENEKLKEENRKNQLEKEMILARITQLERQLELISQKREYE